MNFQWHGDELFNICPRNHTISKGIQALYDYFSLSFASLIPFCLFDVYALNSKSYNVKEHKLVGRYSKEARDDVEIGTSFSPTTPPKRASAICTGRTKYMYTHCHLNGQNMNVSCFGKGMPQLTISASPKWSTSKKIQIRRDTRYLLKDRI